MSTESPSRPPQSNSAKSGSGPDAPDSESPGTPEGLPEVDERVGDVCEAFGEIVDVPVSRSDGEMLRVECTDELYEEYEVELEDEPGTVTREDLVERRAVPLRWAVQEMLEWHADYHRSHLRLEYGREGDAAHDILDVELDNSWMAAYQEQERARLKAMERETCGFETCDVCDTRYCGQPDDHRTEFVEGTFEEPVVALTGRTARGAGRPVVDHAREIADAWSYGGVRRSLRYEIDKLGLESDEWVRWTQAEPHPGEKASAGFGGNTGYGHFHDVMIFDAAAADGEIRADTFKPVIESHVETCDHAGPAAHDLEKDWTENPGEVDTVEVKHAHDDIEESVASYAAAYLSNESKDLLERSPEYLVFAATMWATDTRKATGTDSRTHAIEADKCRHKHAADEQELEHGERLVRSNRRGVELECAACGSPWEIEQTTLARARLEPEVVKPEAVTDGGRTDGHARLEEEREEELRERWSSARSVASVGGKTAERETVGSRGGRELDGRELKLGGGEPWCPACQTENPMGDCSHEEYDSHPTRLPSDGEKATVDETVATGSAQYRGDGEVAYEYVRPVGARPSVSAEFSRPPEWSVKAVVRDGEELPPSGGGVDRRPLKLPEERMGGLPDAVRMERTETGPVYACGACGLRTGEAEMMAPDGAGHVGGNGRCRACEGEVVETVEPDVPVLWPDAGTDGDRGDGGDGLDELAEKVRRYIERERLEEEEVTVAKVAGGLLENPETVREVLERGV